MDDRVLYITSALLALAGLTLLFFVRPAETEQHYVLKGIVARVEGREAVVHAEVALVGRKLKKGDHVSTPVFWNGKAFVMAE